MGESTVYFCDGCRQTRPSGDLVRIGFAGKAWGDVCSLTCGQQWLEAQWQMHCIDEKTPPPSVRR